MTKKEFGRHLATLIDAYGFSQKDLSKLTGIRESTISDWINGKYYPKQDKRLLIAKALKISPTRLFVLDEGEQPVEDGYMIPKEINGMNPQLEKKYNLYLHPENKRTLGECLKDKYKELQELATSITDGIEDDGIALSKGDANTLLELLRLEIMYRYRM